jgi:hypothetical protein
MIRAAEDGVCSQWVAETDTVTGWVFSKRMGFKSTATHDWGVFFSCSKERRECESNAK